MDGFIIAIATKDKSSEDLITFGMEETDNEGINDKALITHFDIFFNTIDKDVKQKSGGMLAKVEIQGKILKAPVLMKKFSKLSEWAHDRRAETTYRNICIGIKSSADAFQAVYTLKNVFVVDYREIYELHEDQDRFELRLTQRENNMDKIEIFSDWPNDWEWTRKKEQN